MRHPDAAVFREAAAVLRGGGLVAFPTETVYGLGADASNENAVSRIYTVKGRPADNPLIAHIASREQFFEMTEDVPAYGRALAETFWPGPLTLVARKKSNIPDWITAGLPTVAVRFPAHPAARALIEASDTVICAPSANLSGRPSPTCAEHVRRDLEGRVEMILDSGPVEIGLESTVVDVTGSKPQILRPGFVTVEMLASVEASAIVSYDGMGVSAPKAPGMKYRHYAPRADMTVVTGDPRRAAREIRRLASLSLQKTGVLATVQTAGLYDADRCLVLICGDRDAPETFGANLFAALRKFDDCQTEVIFAEGIPETGLGAAVMNRLKKAAGGKIIEV
ncbi:MAG: threonylcarbamoyl-AMP synthase [Clostridiales bacterium]|nr:threonylcarbamoyl-AMP synthase [Clostridiales bacterium]